LELGEESKVVYYLAQLIMENQLDNISIYNAYIMSEYYNKHEIGRFEHRHRLIKGVRIRLLY
jgi:hypothetical protein